MKKLFLISVSFCFACAIAGCETVKGVGRDITNSSDAVQKAFTKKDTQSSWGKD